MIPLNLEAIGHDLDQKCRLWNALARDACGAETAKLLSIKPRAPWVCEITGTDPKYRFRRAFIRPIKDYSKCNSRGSRGVYFIYYLVAGHLYEVSENVSWKKDRRFFCIVEGEEIKELSEEAALAWLSQKG